MKGNITEQTTKVKKASYIKFFAFFAYHCKKFLNKYEVKKNDHFKFRMGKKSLQIKKSCYFVITEEKQTDSIVMLSSDFFIL